MAMRQWLLSGVAGSMAFVSLTSVSATSAKAQSAASTNQQIDKLQAQIEAMQREITALKSKVAKTERSVTSVAVAAPTMPITKAPAPPPTAIVKMSPTNRPSICTPDNQNCISLTTRLHLDTGGYWYRPNTPSTVPQQLDDGVNARRARIGVLGTFAGDWNYALIYDFGGSADGFGGLAPGSLSGGGTSGIEQANLSYTGFKPFAIEGGYMDLAYTLEEATSSNDITFMERASPAAVATNIAAGDFRSAVGIRGNTDRLWAGAYLTGPLSGAIHNRSATATVPGASEQMGAIGRVTYQFLQDPYYTLHLGGNVEWLISPSTPSPSNIPALTLSDRPELRIDPTSLLTTGAIMNVSSAQVYSGEAAATWGPLYFQGEYFWYNVDRKFGLSSLDFQGGYAQASWTITGESRKYIPTTGAYAGIIPANPFSLTSGGLGAWEIAFRYSTIDLNDRLGFTDGVSGGRQTIYTVGLNWYVNANIRFMVNYLHGTVDKQVGATNATDAGASFDALAMRTQVAF